MLGIEATFGAVRWRCSRTLSLKPGKFRRMKMVPRFASIRPTRSERHDGMWDVVVMEMPQYCTKLNTEFHTWNSDPKTHYFILLRLVLAVALKPLQLGQIKASQLVWKRNCEAGNLVPLPFHLEGRMSGSRGAHCNLWMEVLGGWPTFVQRF